MKNEGKIGCTPLKRPTSTAIAADQRVIVREEDVLLDTQSSTSYPVCSHNEWDHLEVKGGKEKEGG